MSMTGNNDISNTDGQLNIRTCNTCGFEQAEKNGENFIISCPRCKGMSWSTRRAE